MVSGIIDRVREIAAEIGIDPHMVNLSLGIHGRTDRLPPADIREFTTMCGHGLVSPHLVRDTIRRVKTGKVERMGRVRVHRGAMHLRHPQPQPLRGAAPGKGAALHGRPLVNPT